MNNSLITHQQPVSFTISRLQSPPLTTAITPLQPTEQKIIAEWEQLLTQAQRVNQMAKELETAILELKETASAINSHRRYLLFGGQQCPDICQYNSISLPWVRQKKDGSLLLTKRSIDLFRAEKEAAQLAHQLRQQTKKASQRHKKPHLTNFNLKGLLRFLFPGN